MADEPWWNAHITNTGDEWLAWDETGADTIGAYDSYEEAVKAIRQYADYLEGLMARRRES